MSDNGITLTNLREFQEELREYREVSKKDDATIVNTKLFYIARGAVNITRRVEPLQIQVELEALVKTFSPNSGKRVNKTVQRFGRFGQQYDVPLVALIINYRRGQKGLKGLTGNDMAQAVRKFISAAKSSSAFIASGFLPGVKKFEAEAENRGGAPRFDNGVKQRGPDWGSATTAKPTDYVPTGIIENFAQSKDKTGAAALDKWATRGLQQAFDDEMQSTARYIEEKKQATADKYNSK